MKTPIDIYFDYSKVKGSTELHNKFKREFTICASKEFPDISVIPYDVAFVRAYSQPEICFQMGQKGVLDLIVFGNGWYLLLDTKTGRNNLQTNQKDYRDRIKEINQGVDKAFKINSIIQGLELIRGQYGEKSKRHIK